MDSPGTDRCGGAGGPRGESSPDRERRYTPREERLNWLTHLLGATVVLAFGFPLLRTGGQWREIAARIFYWCTMLAMFLASFSYHFVRDPRRKALCRKFDHCSIYLLILGTYAPLMAGLLPDWRGASVMAALLILTIIGVTVKFCFASRFHRWEVAVYLLMGWLCLTVIGPIYSLMDRTGFYLLLAGGLTYTFGAVFYAVKREFFHAVWHVLTVAGVVLQLLAVLTVRP